MGGSYNGDTIIYLGMDMVLFRRNQHPAANKDKLDPSTSVDPAHWALLGALVGTQTQEIINRGASAWRVVLSSDLISSIYGASSF